MEPTKTHATMKLDYVFKICQSFLVQQLVNNKLPTPSLIMQEGKTPAETQNHHLVDTSMPQATYLTHHDLCLQRQLKVIS